jgi:hypothetical protein
MCVYIVKISYMLAVGWFFVDYKLEHAIVFKN